jgi:hypothetical protein
MIVYVVTANEWEGNSRYVCKVFASEDSAREYREKQTEEGLFAVKVEPFEVQP